MQKCIIRDMSTPTPIEQHVQALQGQINSLRRKLYPLHVKDALAEKGMKARMPIEFRAQFMEDMLLWDTLLNQTKGFYIECGAFDGKSYSVSWVFDAMGWDGLCVEAIPERYAQCVANRPFARVVHSALSAPGAPAEMEFTIVDDQYGGMLSFIGEGGAHGAAMTGHGYGMRKVRVPCTTMNSLLKDHAGPIDFAVIDVEGHEIELLKGFDLARHAPRVLLLEDNDRGKDPALGQYMATKPYIQATWIGHNRVYIHKTQKDLLAVLGIHV